MLDYPGRLASSPDKINSFPCIADKYPKRFNRIKSRKSIGNQGIAIIPRIYSASTTDIYSCALHMTKPRYSLIYE